MRVRSSWLFLFQITASLVILGLVIWKLPAIEGWFKFQPEDGKNAVGRVEPLATGTWRFILSGDSRNCGDVVMPAIAAHSLRYAPSFYWHLGDLRAIYKIDEDMQGASANERQVLTCAAYHRRAWSDFIENQIAPFGSTPFFVGIGNHEVIPPKTEEQFASQFRDWLTASPLNAQRLEDGEKEPLLPRPYYHWIQGGVDFIYLDNATGSFSKEQLDWFDRTLAKDEAKNDRVLSVVIGMHEALPDSIASDHAMCDDPKKVDGCFSGRHVYDALLRFQDKKPVYVMASHSHFFMEGIFDNLLPNRRLPGWIVGTAGAVRYALPPKSPPRAKQDVYGYLLGTVQKTGVIQFEFQEVKEQDVPPSVWQRYPPGLVPWCFAHNSQNQDPRAEETSHRCPPPAAAE
jgi:hypothetical protein